MDGKGKTGVVVSERKYFLAANWKSNGTTHFVKDIVQNLINSFEYDPSKLGKIMSKLITVLDLMLLPGALHISLVKAMVAPHVSVGA